VPPPPRKLRFRGGSLCRRFARNAREPSSRAPMLAGGRSLRAARQGFALPRRMSSPPRKPRFALAYAPASVLRPRWERDRGQLGVGQPELGSRRLRPTDEHEEIDGVTVDDADRLKDSDAGRQAFETVDATFDAGRPAQGPHPLRPRSFSRQKQLKRDSACGKRRYRLVRETARTVTPAHGRRPTRDRLTAGGRDARAGVNAACSDVPADPWRERRGCEGSRGQERREHPLLVRVTPYRRSRRLPMGTACGSHRGISWRSWSCLLQD
jgi:hypothetical protein